MGSVNLRAFVARYVWEPFGNSYSYTGTKGIDLRFPGQMFQAESGLHYNWFRQYDPTIGRYTQPDPLGLEAGIGRYAYVGNDPIQNIDPRGMSLASAAKTPPLMDTVLGLIASLGTKPPALFDEFCKKDNSGVQEALTLTLQRQHRGTDKGRYITHCFYETPWGDIWTVEHFGLHECEKTIVRGWIDYGKLGL